MTILGQEQPVIYRMDDMFDPTTAQMFLNAQQNYVNAMRENYMQGTQDLKEFIKENRDFYSPFAKDNDNYYNLTLGGATRLIDDLRSKGIDPVRSQEGRALLQQYIYSRPYGQLANLKRSAKAGLDYLEEVKKLKEMNKYNKDFDDFVAQSEGAPSFDDYDTLASGTPFNRLPYQYNDLQTDTDDWFKGSEPLFKGTDEHGNRIYELNMDDLKNLSQPYISGYAKTPIGQYRLFNIKKELLKNNPSLSNDQLEAASLDKLKDDIAKANSKYLRRKTFETDPFRLAKYQNDLEKELYNAKHIGDGNGGYTNSKDIFDEADEKAKTDESVYFKSNNSTIMYDHKIDPLYGLGIKQQNYGTYEIPKKSLNYTFTTYRSMTQQGKYNNKKPENLNVVNIIRKQAKAEGIDMSKIKAYGSTATGELKTKIITRGSGNNKKTYAIRAIGTYIWYQVPKNVDNSRRDANDDNNAPEYEVRYVKGPDNEKGVFMQYVEKRGAQYTRSNPKTNTFK